MNKEHHIKKLEMAIERIKKELLIYCGHDTLALVKIRDELIENKSNTK